MTIKVNTGTEDSPVVKDYMVYGEGLAVFEKIPPGVYFIQETGFPTVKDTTLEYKALETMYMVDLNGQGYFTIYTTEKDSSGKIVGEKASSKKAPTTTFAGKDGKYTLPGESTGEGTVDIYTFQNISPQSRKVILRKVDGADYNSLSGAEFTVYYADKTTVAKGTIVNSSGEEEEVSLMDLTTSASGILWTGTLPFGTYYLHETKVPTSKEYSKLSKGDNWFILTVNKDGVGYLHESTFSNSLNPEGTAP